MNPTMIKHYLYILVGLLMAVLPFTSCSDDDNLSADDIEPEPTEEELAELAAADRLEAANYVIRAFAGLDELPDDWETSTFTPQEGVVVDEATPGIRYVIVENQDAADQYFRNITPDELREESGNGYRLYVEDFGSLTYQRTATATCYGVVKVNLPQMPTLTEIRLVPESEVPTNAKYDGNPYYGIGSLVRDKVTKSLYICVRPSGGPNRKEYAYFVSFDPKTITTTTKKMSLYELDEKGKKTKKSATTSGDWIFAKNLVEKRIALAAAMAFSNIAPLTERDATYHNYKGPLYEVSKAFKENGIHIPESEEFFVPYGSFKSSSAGSNRQAKYEQPGLCWAFISRFDMKYNEKDKLDYVLSYVRQRPDAKSHLLTLTDDYDPSYYYTQSEAVDGDDFVFWNGKTVGYQKCFNILDYALNGDKTKRFYPNLKSLTHWGDPEYSIPVLLMTQKKITDKGQASSKFEDVNIVDQNCVTSPNLYRWMWAFLEYFELSDGRTTTYDHDDGMTSMSSSPDI